MYAVQLVPTYVHILPFLSFIPSPHKCTLDLPSTLPRKPIFSFSSLHTLSEYILIYSFYFISPFHHPQRDYFPPTLLTRSFPHLFLADGRNEGKMWKSLFRAFHIFSVVLLMISLLGSEAARYTKSLLESDSVLFRRLSSDIVAATFLETRVRAERINKNIFLSVFIRASLRTCYVIICFYAVYTGRWEGWVAHGSFCCELEN